MCLTQQLLWKLVHIICLVIGAFMVLTITMDTPVLLQVMKGFEWWTSLILILLRMSASTIHTDLPLDWQYQMIMLSFRRPVIVITC
ncbi:hypothetical protein ES703_47452 [subsurface metagenome]